ncbi:procathepsin L-like [Vanessa cardui]|uniref:procathepsin L-like n=1 Tax=Vanessa cardui TaxID=171605 RepID=UPI001F13FC16|nr:procathepsin L-like [Vanessa cardui]
MVNAVLGKSAIRYNLEDAYDHFETFIQTYEKEYDETEKAERFEIFMNNLEHINYLNSRNDSAIYGITKFTDLTAEEFQQKYTGLKIGNYTDDTNIIRQYPILNMKLKEIPDSFDWRSKGVVTPARLQGDCGACWAFSIMGNIESAYAIKTQQTVILSEQQLVDCVTDCNSCIDGFPINACRYLQSHGAMSEDSYPYVARTGPCKYNADNVKVKVTDCVSLKVSEDELAEKLVTIGPLSIAIASAALQAYNGEPITAKGCSGSPTNHAVLLVGYGTDANGMKYWLAKNSWGNNWGDQGYFKMQRGVNCLNIVDSPAVTAIV